MSRAPFPRVALVLCFLLGAGPVPDAAAQFGKLKKAVTGQAEQGVKDAACVPDRPPTYITTVELTPDQMKKVNAGLQAEAETAQTAFKQQDEDEKRYQAEQKAYEKDMAAYNKANEKYQACADKVQAAENAKSEELNRKQEAAGKATEAAVDEDKLIAMAEKAQAAADRISKGQGTAADRATLAEYQQMMSGVTGASNQAMAAMQESQQHQAGASARLEKECGKEPEQPKPPSQAGLPGNKIRQAGADAAGMSPGEYAAARDVMISLAMSNSVVGPGASQGGGGGGGGGGGSGGGKISQEQADAMNQAIKEAGKKLCALRKAGAPI